MGVFEERLSRGRGKGCVHWRDARAVALAAAAVLATAWSHAEPKQADTTPPSVAFINHPPRHANAPAVTFSWDPATDDMSGIATFRLLIGSSPESSDLLDIDVVGEASYTFTASMHGQSIYPALVATDGAGNTSMDRGLDRAVTFDFVAPEVDAPPYVVGINVPPAIVTGYTGKSVRVTWGQESDDGSHVAGMAIDIGSSAGLADYGTIEIPKEHSGFPSEVVYDSGDYLPAETLHGTAIYNSLRVRDAAGNETVLAPSTPVIVDTAKPAVSGFEATSTGTEITFSWGDVTDTLAGPIEQGPLLLISNKPFPIAFNSGNWVFNGRVEAPGSMSFAGTEGPLYAQFRAFDNAGNVEILHAESRFDIVPPTVEFEIVGPEQTIADEVTVITRFNENLGDPLEAEDIDLIGMAGTFTVTAITESEYDVTLIPDDPDADGTMAFEIASTGVEDEAGNVFPGATSPTVTFEHTALIVGSASADCGEEILVPVEVMDADGIDALGFSIEYNGDCLTYLGATAGTDISPGWAFQSQVNGGSKFTIGAFRTTGPAPLTGDAEIAVLRFRFLRETESCSTDFVLVNVVDDVEGYTLVDGFAECGNGPGALPGDVNDDGVVTPADARETFLCYIMGACGPGMVAERAEIAPDNGDNCVSLHDGDEIVDPDDAQRVFEMFLNVGGSRPCN